MQSMGVPAFTLAPHNAAVDRHPKVSYLGSGCIGTSRPPIGTVCPCTVLLLRFSVSAWIATAILRGAETALCTATLLSWSCGALRFCRMCAVSAVRRHCCQLCGGVTCDVVCCCTGQPPRVDCCLHLSSVSVPLWLQQPFLSATTLSLHSILSLRVGGCFDLAHCMVCCSNDAYSEFFVLSGVGCVSRAVSPQRRFG